MSQGYITIKFDDETVDEELLPITVECEIQFKMDGEYILEK